VGDLTSLQRQLDDPFLLDDVADARAAYVDQRSRRFDGDRLFDGAEGEHRVNRRCRADLQHEAGLNVGTETLERNFELVRAGWKTGKEIRPVALRDSGANETRCGLCNGDRRPREDGAARIGDAAIEFGRRQLRMQWRDCE